MNILLIDPDIVLAQVYARYLEIDTGLVNIALSAQQAIELANLNRPDVVVLEIQLPGHNGVEFLHEFRSHVDWQNIPIVVHTLLSESRIDKYANAWRNFNIIKICNKTTTSLEQLKNIVQKVATI